MYASWEEAKKLLGHGGPAMYVGLARGTAAELAKQDPDALLACISDEAELSREKIFAEE